MVRETDDDPSSLLLHRRCERNNRGREGFHASLHGVAEYYSCRADE